MESVVSTVKFSRLFNTLNDDEFFVLKKRVISHWKMYIEDQRNKVVDTAMELLYFNKVCKELDPVRFSRLIEAFFPESIRDISWIEKFCKAIMLIAKSGIATENDPYYDGYKTYVCDKLIPDINKSINVPGNQKKSFELLSTAYRITACLSRSHISRQKIDMNIDQITTHNINVMIINYFENNSKMFSKEELGYSYFICILLEMLILNEEGIMWGKRMNKSNG